MSNIVSLQQQINEHEAKINELQKQINAELTVARTQAIVKAQEIIREFDLTASELGLSGKVSKKGLAKDKGNVVAPKYKDPDSDKTWTGRGKAPGWMSAQLEAGKTKQDFLIPA